MSLFEGAANVYRYEMELPFSLGEYRERMEKVQEAMRKENLDVLFCQAPESMYYLTGYHLVWYHRENTRGVAIHKDAEVDEFIQFESKMEEILARQTSIANDLRIFPLSQDPWKYIVGELKSEGWLKGAVGLELWSHHPNPAGSLRLKEALEKDGVKVVDASHIVREIRAIKSPQEIAYTRIAAAMADIGIQAGIDCIDSGITELDICAEVEYALRKAGSENAGITTMVQSGPKTATIHAPSSRRRILKGDIVSIDISGVYYRYHSDISRVISVGKPHPDIERCVDLLVKAWPEVLEAARPYTPVADLNKAIKDYYERVGLWKDRWWIGGYELGIAFPPDWVGAFFFGPGGDPEDRRLEPGLSLVWESDVYLPHNAGLARVIDTWQVTEKETEILTKLPPGLIVK